MLSQLILTWSNTNRENDSKLFAAGVFFACKIQSKMMSNAKMAVK